MNTTKEIRIITWNTGASYSENGQRVAACRCGDGVYMVDIDRGIDYWFDGIELDRDAIMGAYINNKGVWNRHALPLRALLENAAKQAPIIKW